ncbi:MAG: hypothetical protein K0S47_4035 [Herbinix sp.]|nr:hypothetical protein [Herbinix sp.]
MLCVQRSWTTLAGVSPVTVIASEPCSQTRCVAVMQGAKRVGPKRVQRDVEPWAYRRRPWNV